MKIWGFDMKRMNDKQIKDYKQSNSKTCQFHYFFKIGFIIRFLRIFIIDFFSKISN